MWWNEYVGIPFEERGRSRAGFDCWGLVQAVYAERLGIALPSYLECYETTLDESSISEAVILNSQAHWHDVPLTEIQEFDVLIVRMRGVPMHVAVATRDGHMLHSAAGVGVAHESMHSIKWKNRIIGAVRYGKP